jgi:hypothetical protein
MTDPKPSLADVYDLVTDPDFNNPEGGILYEMATLGGPARSSASLLSQTPGETIGGIMANVFSHMKWLESRALRDMLGASDFSPLDLNNGKTPVYWVQPRSCWGCISGHCG